MAKLPQLTAFFGEEVAGETGRESQTALYFHHAFYLLTNE